MIQNFKTKSKILLLILSFSIPYICVAKENPNLELLETNDQYFIKNIDLNGDKLLDKVVSNKKHEGNELYFFLKKGTTYRFALQSTNFSEDGGNIIKDIHPENQRDEILSISTYFPDGGHLTAQHFIAFKNNDWFLTRTVYETTHWQKDPSKTFVCNVVQNIRLRSLTDEGQGWKAFKFTPEKNWDTLCDVKKLMPRL